MGDPLTIADLLRLARRRAHILLGMLALGLIVAGVFTALQSVRYTAQAQGFVRAAGNQTTTESYSGALLAEKRAQSYVPVVTSVPVASAVK